MKIDTFGSWRSEREKEWKCEGPSGGACIVGEKKKTATSEVFLKLTNKC